MTASSAEAPPSIPAGGRRSDLVSHAFGHPATYVTAVLVLLVLFAGPFIADPDRVAPTKDPAFYTWRTEVFLTEEPTTLLSIEGPKGMFAAGYRVTAPILGGLLRHVVGVGSLHTTVFLMAGLPLLIALLLAGFAYQRFRDPLVWHAVAFGSAGLLLTPPFVGYLDNVLCLFFLSAALYFIESSRESWGARTSLFVFLLLAGLTHPTTLVIFFGTLGLVAALRLVLSKFDLKETFRADGWMLGTALASVLVTVAIWTVGIWGKSVSLAEAALPPPYGAEFFIDRMLLWVDTMRPLLNGPLFLVGIVALLAAGRRLVNDGFARVTLMWLTPLVGLVGFLAGLTYPYYRFFNTTLAWVLLVGVGAGLAIRFFISFGTGQAARVAGVLATAAVVLVLSTNLQSGLSISGWTTEKNEWLEPDTREDLDVLRTALQAEDRNRPVVFVIDDEYPDPFQIYGFSKLSGNTSRYGLPAGQIDRGYLYLGSIENFIAGEPTTTGDDTYDPLSEALLEDAQKGIERAKKPPIVVVAEIFNPAGANVDVASGSEMPAAVTSELPKNVSGRSLALWTLHEGALYQWTRDGRVGLERAGPAPEEPPPAENTFLTLGGLFLLLAPGGLWLWRSRGPWTLEQGIGLVPAMGIAWSIVGGILVVAVLRSPFGVGHAIASLIVGALGLAAVAELEHPGRVGALYRRAVTTGLLRRIGGGLAIVAFLAGIAGWATGTLVGGVVALWAFCLAAACLALVLPLRFALVSPLYMGIAGWLVDMLPLVILVGWTVVTVRWAVGVLRERRLPQGGRFVWLPVALVGWTALGALVITRLDFKHFLLLLGIQVIASAVVLVVVDQLRDARARFDLVAGLLAFVVLLTVAVFLQWIGVNIQTLQNGETRKRVETAYGVDAFPNNIGMIKYARSINAGALEKRRELEQIRTRSEGMPAFEVFRPKFQAYENSLVVRFAGSARLYEQVLNEAGVTLLYDNIGLTPANTVPRMRSFPRNALTYAGICAALFPLAFFFWWSSTSTRRRRFAGVAIASCLFGAAFSLARGAWVAIAIGLIYLFIDALMSRRKKVEMVIAFLIAAVVLTLVFFVKYRVDPVTGRAGGGASVLTREELYQDTLGILKGPSKYVVLGYGTEKPRTESGTVHEGTRYVPRAGTHSTYLNYLFRTGVPGALMIMLLYGLAFFHTRTRARSSNNLEGEFASLSAMSVVIAAAHAVILSLYVEPVYTLTISLLLGVAIANVREGTPLLPKLPALRLPRRPRDAGEPAS